MIGTQKKPTPITTYSLKGIYFDNKGPRVTIGDIGMLKVRFREESGIILPEKYSVKMSVYAVDAPRKKMIRVHDKMLDFSITKQIVEQIVSNVAKRSQDKNNDNKSQDNNGETNTDVAELKRIYGQYNDAKDSKERMRIQRLFEDFCNRLESKDDTVVKALARFFDFPQLHSHAFGSLYTIKTKMAWREISRYLVNMKDTEENEPCLRSYIIEKLDFTSSFNHIVLTDIEFRTLLSNEIHSEGVKAILKLVNNRFNPDHARIVIETIESSEDYKGLNVLDPKDRENTVVNYFLMGFWFRGFCPEIDNVRYLKRETDTKSVLGNLSENSVNTIYNYLLRLAEDTSKKDITRCIALRILGAQKQKAVLNVIKKIVEKEDNNLSLVMAAAKSAGSLGDQAAAQLFVPIIDKMDRHTKQNFPAKKNLLNLLEYLQPLKLPSAEKTVSGLLESKDTLVRIAAIMLLPMIDETVAIVKIRRYINNKNWRIRYAAILACRRLKTAAAVELLIEHMNNENGRLKFDVLSALQYMAGIKMPYVIEDWKKWWEVNKKSYDPFEGVKTKDLGRTKVSFPEAPSYFGLHVISKRVCFICDISGSMSDFLFYKGKRQKKIDVMKKQLLQLIHTFQSNTYFNIIFFSTEYSKTYEHLSPMNIQNYRKVKKTINSTNAKDQTNLYDPLEEALLDPYVDTIYLLSDGDPTCGKYVLTNDILFSVNQINRLRGIQINTISILRDSLLMRRLAEENSGIYVKVGKAKLK